MNELLQKAFRHRSERYLEDLQQLKLDFDSTDEAADAAAGLAEAIDEAGIKPAEIVVREHTRRKRVRKVRNGQLPAHLPRYEVEAAVTEEMKACPVHGPRKVIGHDRVETLEFARPKLKVNALQIC